MKAVIFAGPTLPPGERPGFAAEFDWRPPARRGDLYRAALEQPAVIGVVDGYFEVTPTVWHKEILWAMAQGIRVFGAASIGALRAAELDVFGMQGVGRIYADFRRGALEDDDEVAVLHGPAELGYPPLTEPMVNIRATLDAATRDGVIAADFAAWLTALAKQLFYKQRSFAALLVAADETGGDAAGIDRLRVWLPIGRVDQKRLDALALLDAIAVHLAAGAPPLRVTYDLAETAAWRAVQRGDG